MIRSDPILRHDFKINLIEMKISGDFIFRIIKKRKKRMLGKERGDKMGNRGKGISLAILIE